MDIYQVDMLKWDGCINWIIEYREEKIFSLYK